MRLRLAGGLALTLSGRKLSADRKEVASEHHVQARDRWPFRGAQCQQRQRCCAAALLALAGLLSAPYGEIPYEQLEAAITKLLRAMNSDPARAKAVTSVTEGPRWSEGARTDEYLQRRAGEMMAVLVLARTYGCGVTWG